METRLVAALVIVGALGAWAVWYLGRVVGIWRRLRGDRIVTCPESGEPALVRIDLAIAVTSDAGSEPAALASCSRWPEHAGCDQTCAPDAQAAWRSPSAMVRAWAKGRTCVSCGSALVESRLAGHHIALLEPTGMTREWVDIAGDRLPLALATCLPLCWNCHVAATFRRLHPELVTDREEASVRPDA